MPDLAPFASSALELGAPLIGRALRAFASSVVGALVLGVIVSMGCWWIASAQASERGLIAAAFALLVFAVAAVFVAIKRAILAALVYGLEKLRLGERTMSLVFERILAVDAQGTHGERGAMVARAAERLPLATAEARLRSATDALLRDDPSASFFRRRIRAAAIERVSTLTLTRFREANAKHGGVDLALVQAELVGRVDELVVDALRGAAIKVAALVLGLATLASCLVAISLR